MAEEYEESEVSEETVQDEIVEKARSMGWVPLDEWKGNPDLHRPADEFVERGEQILPIVKKRLNDEISEYKRQLDTVLKTQSTEIERIKELTLKQARAEYDTKLKELAKQEIQAVQDGDVEAYTAVQSEKNSLKPPEDAPKDPEPTGETGTFKEWKKDNGWYELDDDLTDLAYAKAGKLQQAIKDGKIDQMPEMDFYREVEKQVRAAMPHKFTNPNRDKAGMTEGSGHEKPRGNSNSWKDVPASAKATFKRQSENFKKQGIELSRDEWVKEYFEG